MPATAPKRRPSLRARVVAVLTALTLAGVVASCGDDDSAGSDETTIDETTSAEDTSAPDDASAPDDTMPTDESTTAPDDGAEAGAVPWPGAAVNTTPVDDATAAEWQALAEEALLAAAGVPGAWVAISDPDLGYWSAAIGEAEVGGAPATLDDHGRIGSITKTMTATAVLEQVEQGNLALDDTVGDLVPDIAEQFPATAELTVELLLGMESGLPDYANVPGAATAQAVEDPTKVWTPEELIEAALGAAEVQPPGTPGYSTTNYTILGRILEAVTGDSVENLVTGVAEEAGLAETALLPGEQNDMPEPFSNGYIDDAAVADLEMLAGVETVAGTDVTDWSMSWGGAGGGAYSTIGDLFQWTTTGMGTTLLADDLAEQRLVLDTVMPDEGLLYGLGIFQLLGLEQPWIGHTGQAIGWEAFGFYDTETGAAMAVMINGTSGLGPFYGVWDEIFQLGLGL